MSYPKGLSHGIICLLLLSLLLINAACSKKKVPQKDFTPLDTLPLKVVPGDIPAVALSPEVLAKLFPELKNPRIMELHDFPDAFSRKEFVNYGYSFTLGGDFNNDGIADIVLVGKYMNPVNPNKNSFIAMMSIQNQRITREQLFETEREQAALKLLRKPKFLKGLDGILVAYTFGSENCGVIYWNGIEYSGRPCSHIATYMYEDNFDAEKWLKSHRSEAEP